MAAISAWRFGASMSSTFMLWRSCPPEKWKTPTNITLIGAGGGDAGCEASAGTSNRGRSGESGKGGLRTEQVQTNPEMTNIVDVHFQRGRLAGKPYRVHH